MACLQQYRMRTISDDDRVEERVAFRSTTARKELTLIRMRPFTSPLVQRYENYAIEFSWSFHGDFRVATNGTTRSVFLDLGPRFVIMITAIHGWIFTMLRIFTWNKSPTIRYDESRSDWTILMFGIFLGWKSRRHDVVDQVETWSLLLFLIGSLDTAVCFLSDPLRNYAWLAEVVIVCWSYSSTMDIAFYFLTILYIHTF